MIFSSQNVCKFPPFSPAPWGVSRFSSLLSGDILYHWRNFTRYHKRHPKLVNASWLWRITRGIYSNQKRRNIWTENKQGHLTSYINSIFFQALEERKMQEGFKQAGVQMATATVIYSWSKHACGRCPAFTLFIFPRAVLLFKHWGPMRTAEEIVSARDFVTRRSKLRRF